MAQKLQIDTGVKEYQINENGVLRFNPSDPNVYERFIGAVDEVGAIEKDYENAVAKSDADAVDEHGFPMSGKTVLQELSGADRKIKKILSGVFGEQNDFDALLGGVNLMAVASNGERVITNLFAALEPIIGEGVQAHLNEKSKMAVQLAEKARAARGDVK